jgi:hypothetical protein
MLKDAYNFNCIVSQDRRKNRLLEKRAKNRELLEPEPPIVN